MELLSPAETFDPTLRSAHQIRMFERMVLIGCVPVIIFNIFHLAEGMYALMAVQVPILLVNVLNLFWLRSHRRIQTAVIIMLTSVAVMLLGTTILGGMGNGGALWLSVYPLLAFLLDGKQRGVYWTVLYNFALGVICSIELFGVDLTPYDSEFLLVAVGSTLTMSVLLYAYESLRQELVDALIVSRQKAEAANVAKSNFLANMNHEIRTPMNGILGFSKILLSDELSTKARKHAEVISTASETLLGLIDDVLELSKIEADKIKLAPVPTQLRPLIDELIVLFKHSATEKGLKLKVEYDEQLPEWIEIDALRFRQILINLLGNAIKFTEQGGISIRLRAQSGQLAIELEDTGIGIPEEMRESIFEQFSQADNTLSRAYSGGGLGLSIVRRLVKLMQGTISVESQLEAGSCFLLRLPLNSCDAPIGEGVDDDLPAHFLARVLVAEDDEINRMVVGHFLDGFGCENKYVENGRSAVDEVAQQHYDLVLMDLHMPELDGIAATKKIRESNNKVPIVALTADALSSERDACLEAGMNDFLIKPLQQEKLQQVLAKFCSSA